MTTSEHGEEKCQTLTMADRSVAQKLGIGPDSVVALVHAEPTFSLVLPSSATIRRSARGSADVVLAFFTRAARLASELDRLAQMIYPSGSLWIAWPKRASDRPTDLSDHVVRAAALARALVDNKVCALDDTWSALRLVWRVEMRRENASTLVTEPLEQFGQVVENFGR
jgi:hypothetical protein